MRTPVALGLIAAATAVAIAGMSFNAQSHDTAPQTESFASSATSTSSSPTTTSDSAPADPETCENGYPVILDPNEGANWVSKKNEKGHALETAEQDLQMIALDPKNLAARADNLHLADAPAPTEWKSLMDASGKCLNTKGVMLFAEVKGALTGSGIAPVENAQAPANYLNSGMSEGGPVINTVPGITGDLEAIEYTLKDGTKVWVLKRCGNLALPSAPKHYAPQFIPQPPPVIVTPPRITTQPPPPGCPGVCQPTTRIPPPPPTTRIPPPPPPCTDCRCNGTCPTTTIPAPKIPTRAPGNGGPGDGGFGQNGGGGAPPVTGPASAPEAGTPPPVYQQPAPPQEAPVVQAPVIVPVIIPPAQQQTVAPAAPASDPNNGVLPTAPTGGGSGGEFGN